MIERKMSWAPSTETLVVESVQDVEPILKNNRRLYNEDDRGWAPSRDLRRVASIPSVVVEMWMKEGVNFFDKNCWPEIKRRLNDSENLAFRTAPGRI